MPEFVSVCEMWEIMNRNIFYTFCKNLFLYEIFKHYEHSIHDQLNLDIPIETCFRNCSHHFVLNIISYINISILKHNKIVSDKMMWYTYYQDTTYWRPVLGQTFCHLLIQQTWYVYVHVVKTSHGGLLFLFRG